MTISIRVLVHKHAALLSLHCLHHLAVHVGRLRGRLGCFGLALAGRKGARLGQAPGVQGLGGCRRSVCGAAERRAVRGRGGGREEQVRAVGEGRGTRLQERSEGLGPGEGWTGKRGAMLGVQAFLRRQVLVLSKLHLVEVGLQL